MRSEVRDLLDAGSLPSEDAPEGEIERFERLIGRIHVSVTDVEACALISSFGVDNCYGLSWSLLHLIETAPGALTAEYPKDSKNPWVQLLRARVEAARVS